MPEYQDWGLINYNEAWDRQRLLVSEIKSGRKKSTLVFCQHPTVITIGKTGTIDNVLQNVDYLNSRGVEVVYNNRGGDVTLHNPGQLVGYPIFNLKDFRTDLHWFLREIEAVIIELLASYGIASGRVEGLTGVWIGNLRKICAIGLHCSGWVTSHGFALNVNNDMDEFSFIVPCGIDNKEVTSMSNELGMNVAMDEVKRDCKKFFDSHF